MTVLKTVVLSATIKAYKALIELHHNPNEEYTLPNANLPGDFWFPQFGEDLAKHTSEGVKLLGKQYFDKVGAQQFSTDVIVGAIRSQPKGGYTVRNETIYNPEKENK